MYSEPRGSGDGWKARKSMDGRGSALEAEEIVAAQARKAVAILQRRQRMASSLDHQGRRGLWACGGPWAEAGIGDVDLESHRF
jgi:hypothetical protein